MKILQRLVHAVSVLAAVLLGGAVLYFILSSVGLRVASSDTIVGWALMTLPWLQLVFVIWGVWKKASYRVLRPVIGLCGGFVIYLVWDDPVRSPPPETGPIAPADSKSYATYRWFVKDDPQNRLAEQDKALKELPMFPTDHAKRLECFAQHREAFTQAWKVDTIGREWINAMSQYTPEGIYPIPRTIGGSMLVFSPLKNGF